MKTKKEIIKEFDPNGPAQAGTLFGLPFSEETAEVIVVPVPWEVTVSYRDGTANGPSAILDASSQVDLAMRTIKNAWQLGIYMLPESDVIQKESKNLRPVAKKYIESLDNPDSSNESVLKHINDGSKKLNQWVFETTKSFLDKGKLVALLGGDHSTPLGFIKALAEKNSRFAILQIDAHADLRNAYEGFSYSHASIMFNALKLPSVSQLVQVGIRDYCSEELDVIDNSKGRIKTFFDEDIKESLLKGKTWENVCVEIVDNLPEHVYISFDIDGLDPKLCPNTGTPVAGGFDFHEIVLLLKVLAKSGKKIIGFDLNEVSPGNSDWDANVGARILYQLCNWMGVSQGKLEMKS